MNSATIFSPSSEVTRVFLAERLTRDAYATVIDLFVERQVNPPTTPERFHAAIARNHPRLFAAHTDLYDVEPERGIHSEPAVIFRGARCLRCDQIVADADKIINGLGPECRCNCLPERWRRT